MCVYIYTHTYTVCIYKYKSVYSVPFLCANHYFCKVDINHRGFWLETVCSRFDLRPRWNHGVFPSGNHHPTVNHQTAGTLGLLGPLQALGKKVKKKKTPAGPPKSADNTWSSQAMENYKIIRFIQTLWSLKRYWRDWTFAKKPSREIFPRFGAFPGMGGSPKSSPAIKGYPHVWKASFVNTILPSTRSTRSTGWLSFTRTPVMAAWLVQMALFYHGFTHIPRYSQDV